MRKGLPFDANKTNLQLIADLMNYDRSDKGIEGKAIVIREAGKVGKIHIECEKKPKQKGK